MEILTNYLSTYDAAELHEARRLLEHSLSADPNYALGAFPKSSSISPVAIRITRTALPITSAGRFSPLGPFGIQRSQ
jgi:hypothetical protein